MLGIYFSGTGNTRFVVNEFISYFDNSVSLSIDDKSLQDEFSKHDTIIFGFPVYFSDTPKIVKDFIYLNKENFKNKSVFIIATQAMFSGDGAGVLARALKKYKVKIIGAIQIKMPSSISDSKFFRKQESSKMLRVASIKIYETVKKFKKNHPPRVGLSIFSRLLGLIVQRMWFRRKTARYQKGPKLDKNKCNKCSTCLSLCPTANISFDSDSIKLSNKCTLCYRCINYCPQSALTLFGKQVYKRNITENNN